MTPRRTIKVSRAGLTRCPTCNAHIQVAEDIAQTACVFCGAELGAALSQPGALERMLNVGRGGMVAASLFGFTALSACPSDTEPTSDTAVEVTTDVAPDYAVGDVYGLPADIDVPLTPDATADAPIVDVVPDATIDALYGLPPDIDDGPDAVEDAAVDADASAQPEAVPLYGLPPDAFPGPDAAEDSGPTDAGSHDAADGDAEADGDAASDGVSTDDLAPVPLYGIPPSPDAQQ